MLLLCIWEMGILAIIVHEKYKEKDGKAIIVKT
jgi:hypothetical protein